MAQYLTATAVYEGTKYSITEEFWCRELAHTHLRNVVRDVLRSYRLPYTNYSDNVRLTVSVRSTIRGERQLLDNLPALWKDLLDVLGFSDVTITTNVQVEPFSTERCVISTINGPAPKVSYVWWWLVLLQRSVAGVINLESLTTVSDVLRQRYAAMGDDMTLYGTQRIWELFKQRGFNYDSAYLRDRFIGGAGIIDGFSTLLLKDQSNA